MSTWLARINFFIKLAVGCLVMAVAWLAGSPVVSVALMAAVLLLLAVARVPGLRAYLLGAALLTTLVLVTWTLTFRLDGQSWGEALPAAVHIAARLVATTGAFFFVVETSSAGAILAAGSAARLPPIVTLVLALLFGLIPMLRAEFVKIGEAQRARGLELDEVGLVTKLRYALARGVPLMVQAIRMAHAISLGLALGGYDLKRRRTTWRHVGWLVEDRLPRGEGGS